MRWAGINLGHQKGRFLMVRISVMMLPWKQLKPWLDVSVTCREPQQTAQKLGWERWSGLERWLVDKVRCVFFCVCLGVWCVWCGLATLSASTKRYCHNLFFPYVRQQRVKRKWSKLIFMERGSAFCSSNVKLHYWHEKNETTSHASYKLS